MTYTCPFCDYDSYEIYHLQRHQNRHDHLFECNPCSKNFYSRHALDQHTENSNVHRSVVTKCKRCKRGFTSRMALIQHQERSSRCDDLADSLYQAVSCLRIFNNLAIEDNPHADRSIRIKYSATDRAYNRHTGRWRCFCDRDFGTKSALDQHLCSRYHDAKSFACPAPGCHRPFSELSALIQHIERRSCKFGAFDVVNKALQNSREIFKSIGW